MTKQTKKPTSRGKPALAYGHPGASSTLRPEAGAQDYFRRKGEKKEPKKYRYDSSLAPVLNWDENAARVEGEKYIAKIQEAVGALAELQQAGDGKESREQRAAAEKEITDAAEKLKRLGAPFLDWSGKAEGQEFSVPTLPLFTHERLSTKAIMETLQGHKRDAERNLALFHESDLSITEKMLKAYEHQNGWTNRMILGDSLRVMNSLLRYENLGGAVQTVYMDPPYGIKFGSNFQPFVRRRDVKHGDDEHMVREPETVQAYRDTWELGIHSYLSYMRDRLFLARELLHRTGSIFVQISEDNLHHVREVMDDVFGETNFAALICFIKTSGAGAPAELKRIPATTDYLLWYARDIEDMKYRPLYLPKEFGGEGASSYTQVELLDGTRRTMTREERLNSERIPDGSRIFRYDDMSSQSGGEKSRFPVIFEDNEYRPLRGSWKTGKMGMEKLKEARRLGLVGNTLRYIRYFDDFPVIQATNLWKDTGGGASDKTYVVQTASKVIQRCMLMTTDPGDLVFDPTCGSGTTAVVAEQWGRRWITCDTSRVPLALARQRLLTKTYHYYQLREPDAGPAGGFVYERKQDKKGREVGGIVQRATLRSIARGEMPEEVVLVDKPSTDNSVARITGAFCFEAIIPTPMTKESATEESAEEHSDHLARMLEVLRMAPVIKAAGREMKLRDVRAPAKALTLHAEARLENEEVVAFVFGPENGAVIDPLVAEAAREACAKNYRRLFVVGFAIEPKASTTINQCEEVYEIPAEYVQATADLQMGQLLKTQRSNQIFAVCGRPDVALAKADEKDGEQLYTVHLRGLDVFNPVSMETKSTKGDDVPMWLLDTDYDGQCFRVSQAFFPRTSAWDNIKRAIKTEFDDSVWDHLAGDTSAPFPKGKNERIAVKVIDERGNELVVEKKFEEAK